MNAAGVLLSVSANPFRPMPAICRAGHRGYDDIDDIGGWGVPGFIPRQRPKGQTYAEMAPRAGLPYLEPTYKARNYQSSSIIVIMAFVLLFVFS